MDVVGGATDCQRFDVQVVGNPEKIGLEFCLEFLGDRVFPVPRAEDVMANTALYVCRMVPSARDSVPLPNLFPALTCRANEFRPLAGTGSPRSGNLRSSGTISPRSGN